MQDNFKQLSEYLEKTIYSVNSQKSPAKEFYFNVSVIKRHIDGHKSGNSLNRTIKQYFISSVEQFEQYKDEIITMCEVFSARAYFDPQLRSWKDLALEANYELAERLISGDLEKIHRVIYRAAAKCKRKALWILDVDEPRDLPLVKEFLTNVYDNDTLKIRGYDYSRPLLNASDIIEVKTNKGYHLIVPPFDTRWFVERFKNVEVKKNNMTLLYYPASLK